MAALALSAFAAGAASVSQRAVVELDPERTVVAFRVAGTLHDVEGTFELKSGRIEVDPAARRAAGRVVVDASSGDSGNARRDARMRDFVLAASRYPEIVFCPTRVEGSQNPDGSFAGTLFGVLTLRGVEREIAIAVEGIEANGHVAATGRFSVPYVAWGLPDPSFFLLRVAGEVELELHVSGRLAREEVRER
jgi:polyisoprenoid-binding protein YceI